MGFTELQLELALSPKHHLAACSCCRLPHSDLTLLCGCAEDSAEEEEAAAAKPTRAGVKRSRAAVKHAGEFFLYPYFFTACKEQLSV